ncbi:DUF6233 domain-containing protein [Streptomyces monashensis]|uniref:DUF6233 domain-containing protein n=1 Tax=Streptomyces monashensis TaxID=1678012 RepID=UPI0033CA225B
MARRQAETERGRRARPQPPEWIVELGIGVGRQPVRVHAGSCGMVGTRQEPVDRTEARRLLADGVTACTHCCWPDTARPLRPPRHPAVSPTFRVQESYGLRDFAGRAPGQPGPAALRKARPKRRPHTLRHQSWDNCPGQ